jgi:hypothetical protein
VKKYPSVVFSGSTVDRVTIGNTAVGSIADSSGVIFTLPPHVRAYPYTGNYPLVSCSAAVKPATTRQGLFPHLQTKMPSAAPGMPGRGSGRSCFRGPPGYASLLRESAPQRQEYL